MSLYSLFEGCDDVTSRYDDVATQPTATAIKACSFDIDKPGICAAAVVQLVVVMRHPYLPLPPTDMCLLVSSIDRLRLQCITMQGTILQNIKEREARVM